MHPVLARVGDHVVYTFGVLAAVAFAVGGTITARELVRRGMRVGPAAGLVGVMGVGGLLGARVWWLVATYGPLPAAWPSLEGGLVWWGGVAGGALVGLAGARGARMPVGLVVDAMAPGAAIGLAIGRLGCHLAGDGDWGTPTALPWGVSYQNGAAGWPHPLHVRVHPAALYECAASLVVFAWLLRAARGAPSPGRIFAWWCVLAGLTRVLVETVRTNQPALCGLTAAQLVGTGIAGAGTVALIGRSWWFRPR